jgi:hypothetical protein
MVAKKRQTSGYIVFCKELRPKLHASNPSLSFGAIAKKLGQMWKDLSEAEKAVYVDRSKPSRGFRKGPQ